ncbi:LexA family protein [Anaeromicrobium sediminis]|uniref:LexA repressor DNA-binding domain-containing protein n=1 Tax=Anaeromicrobium sediminis TaxID=1478221 RepID=A0A267MNJ5_9FIRM|nr:hypothetical protein [Anaeromicrobium sediminis]PAB61149.1 hypothetical protein CCE28_01620 [Anaeromicrobium sediminis]
MHLPKFDKKEKMLQEEYLKYYILFSNKKNGDKFDDNEILNIFQTFGIKDVTLDNKTMGSLLYNKEIPYNELETLKAIDTLINQYKTNPSLVKLANLLNLKSQISVSNRLKKLQKAGYITIEKKNKIANNIVITDKGGEIL